MVKIKYVASLNLDHEFLLRYQQSLHAYFSVTRVAVAQSGNLKIQVEQMNEPKGRNI